MDIFSLIVPTSNYPGSKDSATFIALMWPAERPQEFRLLIEASEHQDITALKYKLELCHLLL